MRTRLWTLFYCPFVSVPMGEGDRRWGNSGPSAWNDNSGPQQSWVQRRTISLSQGCELGVLCEGHVYQTKEREKQRQRLRQ